MKISGQDQIIRILMEMNANGVNTNDPEQSERIEVLSKEIEKIVVQKDQVILGSRGAWESEVQFSRGSNESPEAYLQRISAEIITQKESLKNENHGEFKRENLNNIIVEQALRSGLVKDGNGFSKDPDDVKSSAPKEVKWLKMMTALFVMSLLMYLIFIK